MEFGLHEHVCARWGVANSARDDLGAQYFVSHRRPACLADVRCEFAELTNSYTKKCSNTLFFTSIIQKKSNYLGPIPSVRPHLCVTGQRARTAIDDGDRPRCLDYCPLRSSSTHAMDLLGGYGSGSDSGSGSGSDDEPTPAPAPAPAPKRKKMMLPSAADLFGDGASSTASFLAVAPPTGEPEVRFWRRRCEDVCGGGS